MSLIAGRYRLEREIGRGGMGAVWLAKDETLGRLVAMKRVGANLDGHDPADDILRAEREAKLAARLNHPCVVAVYDLLDDPSDGTRWLVMEYVEGENLGSVVAAHGRLDPDQAARLMAQAAEGLAAAHRAGIVHRDVKPSNIMVEHTGQVKLTDFGIARGEADASLTRTGLVTGSPAYLAPEVATGATATPASDVWSLGATLYHALEGHPPYETTDNVVSTLYRIAHEHPTRPTNPGWLAPVFEATMTRAPEDRWSMAEVHRFLASGAPVPEPTAILTAPEPDPLPVPSPIPIPSPLPSTTRVEPAVAAPRQPARSPKVAFVAAALVIAVLLLFGGWLLLRGNGGTPNEAAQQPTPSATPTPTPTPSTTPTLTPEQQAQAMEDFVRQYLATATSDSTASFAMLTPGFQTASGGLQPYRKFWNTYRTATPSNFQTDPATGTIQYTVDYVAKAQKRNWTDQVQLQLQESAGGYLIAGEAG